MGSTRGVHGLAAGATMRRPVVEVLRDAPQLGGERWAFRRVARPAGWPWRRALALAAGPAVLATMFPAMRWASGRLGRERGYVAGFAVYWGAWCLGVPLALVGRRCLWARARRPAGEPRGAQSLLLAVGPVGAATTLALRARGVARPRLLLAAAAVGALNGTLEELLWRSVFVELFAEDRLRAVVWPTVWFALWHVAPQAVESSEHPVRFIAEAALVGGAWATIAQRTGGVRWTIASHVLTDAMDLDSPVARFLASGS
jgi:hypothetical protein